MAEPRIGELFAGYGGLGMGVQAALGGEVAWYSEIDKGALKILGHRFPGVPNIDDITAVDWSTVEPVDILTGGSPCQDLSHAGKRAGMTDGTRSNLWVAMREAIAELRPGLVIWENVRGAYSACADSEMGRCPRCLDPDYQGAHAPWLRALGRVLGDLSELGYVGGWHGLRAADVGAPHGRFRVFVVARTADAQGIKQREPFIGMGERPEPLRSSLLPSPTTSDANGAGQHGGGGLDLRTAVSLLPTPAVNDMGAAYTSDEWDAWTERMKADHGNGNGHEKSLHIEAARLTEGDPAEQYMERLESFGPDAVLQKRIDRQRAERGLRWGQYAAAIARWESIHGPAPTPTETGPKGNPHLSPAFSEWMMGLPVGWVTNVPDITRNEALRALGNGVVPQQSEAAVRFLLGLREREVAPIDGYLLPTPNPFHAGNTEEPEEWRKRRADVFARTGTRHGPALSVVALSIAEGKPLTPDHYMPDDEEV